MAESRSVDARGESRKHGTVISYEDPSRRSPAGGDASSESVKETIVERQSEISTLRKGVLRKEV